MRKMLTFKITGTQHAYRAVKNEPIVFITKGRFQAAAEVGGALDV